MKTPVSESFLNRVAGLRTCNFIQRDSTFLLRGFVSALNSIVPPQAPLQGLQSSLYRVLNEKFLPYLKKRKISRNSYSLSLFVSRCITRLSFYKRSIESALIEFKICSKADFSRNSHHKETSNFICIANPLRVFLFYKFLLKGISDQNCDYKTL